MIADDNDDDDNNGDDGVGASTAAHVVPPQPSASSDNHSAFAFSSQWLATHESKLLPHQQNAVDTILARDSTGAAGHLVVMDTGLGKTLTAATALLKLLSQSSEYQRQVR